MPNIYISYTELDRDTCLKIDAAFKTICRDLLGLEPADVLCFVKGVALDSKAQKSLIIDFEWYPRDDISIQDTLGRVISENLASLLAIELNLIEVQFYDINKRQYYIKGDRLAET